MLSLLSALLCLGLSLVQRTRMQTEMLPKPTIWAEPGSVIPWESNVTIWCQGTLEAQEFHLCTEDMNTSLDKQKPLEPGDKAKFFIKDFYAGRYYCKYFSPTGWSEHSEPLELVGTGSYGKPSLSALPSPVVTSGGNMTLQCGSVQAFDRFVLTKDGEHKLSWTLNSHRHGNKWFRALFPVDSMNLSHSWTFRCYGYFNKSSHEWSHPSEPLDLLVSRGSDDQSILPTESSPQRGLPWYLFVLIGVSVTLILLLSLLLSLLLFQHQSQSKGRTLDAAMEDPQADEGMDVDPQQNKHDTVSQEVTYAQVNLSRSRLRQGMATSVALSGGWVDRKDRQAEGDRQMDSPADAPDASQDVTYVQMNHKLLRQETTSFSSLSEGPPDEPSVYAALAVH
ncbi:leukocyte immunoglobulin-like receptor subfamily B member 4 [Saccopteryx leptura]|uniref:leukocyte immunoglobulin-like receptor subfamily B member 4 n=1 Tax=Saccopteryx leptura TaxID=249018 RepID=UPI00339CDED4